MNGLRESATLVEASSNTRIKDQPMLKMILDVEMRAGVVLPVHANPDPQQPGDMLVR